MSPLSREEILENLAMNKAAERLTVIMGRFRHAGVDSEDMKALKRGILALRSFGSRDEVILRLTDAVLDEVAENSYKEGGWRARIRATIVNALCGPRPELSEREKMIGNDASPRRISNGA
jgi:hypothetical protein